MISPDYYVALADAICERINGGTYDGWTFEATREFEPAYELDDMATVKVSVIPAAKESKFGSRGESDRTYTVDVAIQKKLASQSQSDRRDELDDLTGLVSAIEQRLDRVGYSRDNTRTAKWIGSQIDPLWVEEHLREFGQFSSVIRLTYRD